MDAETLKLLGNGGSQMILVFGYLPVLWLVRALWKERGELSDKFLAMLGQQFDDASRRKDLWDGQAKVIEGQTQATRDLKQEIQSLRADIQQRARV